MSQSAIVLKDRVKETTTTTGTGTITLAGAAPGFAGFSAIGTGSSTYYTIVDGSAWEVGIGYYQQGTSTLTRDTVLSSSNAGAKINLGAGTKDVFVTLPGDQVLAGVVWSEAVTHTVAVNDPATGYNYYYPCIVNGASPFYIAVDITDGSTGYTTYQKILALSGGQNSPVTVLGNDFSTAWCTNVRLHYASSGFRARAGVSLYFGTLPPVGFTVTVRIGYLPARNTFITPVKTWSTSSSAPAAYTSIGLTGSSSYTRSTSTRGSKWAGDGAGLTAISYATSAGSASSASYATDSGSTQALQSYPVSNMSPTDGYVLTWDSGSYSWRPEPAAGGGGGVTSIIAGTGITISSTGPGGTGDVTINASGGGGGSAPPGGSYTVSMVDANSAGTIGYVPNPSSFDPALSSAYSSEYRVFVLSTSSSQPTSTPYPFTYVGTVGPSMYFNGSYYYVHYYVVNSFNYAYVSSSGFFYSGVSPTTVFVGVFAHTVATGPVQAGYNTNGFINYPASGPTSLTYPSQPVPPPPSVVDFYDSKLLVFFASPTSNITPYAGATGVTEEVSVQGIGASAALYKIPSTLVSRSPNPPQNVLQYSAVYNGLYFVGTGYEYTP